VTILRPYQQRDLATLRSEFIRGARKVCYAAPTGSGKTVLFAHLAGRIVASGQRVAVIVHRQELVDQVCAALAGEGRDYGVVAAGYAENPAAPVQVCMVWTLVNRLDRLAGITFLIVDEAHHTPADTWLVILRAASSARVLGVTATPERLDGKGLADVFEVLVTGPTVAELIAAGWLSPFIVYAPERLVDLKGASMVAGDYAVGDLARRMSATFVLEDAVTEYRKHLAGRSAIAFCPTIAHSWMVAQTFRDHGINAQHLDGDTPAAERRDLIARFGAGQVDVITNCALLGEGLDVPSVAGVILLRPTKSLALHLQQIGRALRPAPGKARAIILDHAGNALRHGLPDLEHAWSLAGRPKKTGTALVRRCPDCGAVIPISARECPECGANLRPEPETKPAATPEPLIEFDPATAHRRWLAQGPFPSVIQWAGRDEARLREVAAARGYKAGWVFHRLKHSRQEQPSP
jgi:superfamily II DNA or RNA helicase